MSSQPKVPTIEEYRSYDGAHCHQLWKQLSESWCCPGCKRTKFEIMRWTTRYFQPGIGKCSPYKGWMAGLHRHHDHYQDFVNSRNGRFAEVVICDQCNASDGAAKRNLKLPENFSFSPLELWEFVKAIPHGKHKINFVKAHKVYERLNI